MAEKVLKTELSAEDRQFNKNKWFFSVSGIGRDMSYQLIASFLLTYIQFGFPLSVAGFATLSLLLGVLGRIWDAINDPLMGSIIEGTHMKFGKFKPWILIGAVTCGAVIIAMFNVQNFAGANWETNFIIFMTVMYLLWEGTFTMNDIGYWSMLASLSSKKEQRNSVTMLTVIFAGVGAFIAQGCIGFLYPGHVREAFSWISIVVGVVFIGMQVVCAFAVKERPRSEMEVNEKVSLKQMWDTIIHNDQILWMTLAMFFYNIGSELLTMFAYNLYYLEIGYDGNAIVFIAIFGVFNIGSQVFYPKLENWLGRRKLQKYAIILACIGYAGIALLGWTSILPFNLVTLSLFGVCVFVGQALFYMSCIINMTNCVEYNEYKRGERNEAVVSTLRPFMAKFASAATTVIFTVVLTVSGVYGLSHNISNMESQKSYLEGLHTTAEQTAYISAANDCYALIAEGKTNDEIDDVISSTEALQGTQLQAEYLESFGDVLVAYKNDDGSYTQVGYIKDSNLQDSLASLSDDVNLLLIIRNDGSMVGIPEDYNAADDNFYSKGTIAERLWIRAAVTILPVIMLVASLIIQNKKFIIDEKYYDMMLEEIAKRKETNAQ